GKNSDEKACPEWNDDQQQKPRAGLRLRPGDRVASRCGQNAADYRREYADPGRAPDDRRVRLAHECGDRGRRPPLPPPAERVGWLERKGKDDEGWNQEENDEPAEGWQ